MTRQSAAPSPLTAPEYLVALRDQLAPLPVEISSHALSVRQSNLRVYVETNSQRKVFRLDAHLGYGRRGGVHHFRNVSDVTRIARQLIRLLGEERAHREASRAASAQREAQVAREQAVVERLQPVADVVNARVKGGLRTVSHLEGDSQPSGEVLVSLRLNDLTEAQAAAVLALVLGQRVEAPAVVEAEPVATGLLVAGRVYDQAALQFVGWTVGDGTSTEGYAVEHFFDAAGRYIGADWFGIEPRFVLGTLDQVEGVER